MTLPVYAPNFYIGNGATATYSYTFKIFAKTDLRVIKTDLQGTETVLVVDVDYTVTGAGNSGGGSITLTAGNLPSGYGLAIHRIRPLIQTTDIRNQGPYYPEIHEDTFDHLIMVDQQQQQEINRTLRLSDSINESLAKLERTSAERAGKALVFDSLGNPDVDDYSAVNYQAMVGTSRTSVLIGTGSKTFETQPNKSFSAGQFVLIVSAASSANYMHGRIASYSGTTLVVNVTNTGGSGTYADWNISISGSRGPIGPQGEITGPATHADNYIPQWDGVNTKKLKEGFPKSDLVISPATHIDNYIPQWDGVNTKKLKEGIAVPIPVVSGGTGATNLNHLLGALEEVVPFSANITLNFATAKTKVITLTGNTTLAFSNPVAGQVYRIILIQDATGRRTVTWPAGIKWAAGIVPVLTIAPNGVDIITIVYANSTYYASWEATRRPYRGALVYRTAAQPILHDTYTVINWNAELYDTDAIHDNVNYNSRLTVPSGVTKVRLQACSIWTYNLTGLRLMVIQKNGASFLGGPSSYQLAASFSGGNMISPVVQVVAGDFFEVVVYQNSGGTLDFGGGDINRIWFAMEIIE